MDKTLKQAVKDGGVTLMAINLGVSVATIYNWINKTHKPRKRDLDRLKELGIHI